VLSLDGARVCHMGDFGQAVLREEQAAAIGEIDLLFVPVGAGPTIDAAGAAAVVERLRPRWVVPMHYRAHYVNFLEPVDGFLERFPAEQVLRLDAASFDTGKLPADDGGPFVVVPATP